MRRFLSPFTAALAFCLLALVLSAPSAFNGARAAGQTLQEKCDECSIRNIEQFNHCLAVHGENDIRCYDQFNEGVVICFRNFCEQ